MHRIGLHSLLAHPLCRIMLLALVIRVVVLAVILPDGSYRNNDSQSYIRGAVRLLADIHRVPPIPYSYVEDRTPGYPLLLASVYLFACGDRAVIWTQFFLSWLLVALVWIWGTLLLRPREVIGLTFLAAVEPLVLVLAAQILTETWFLVVLLLFLIVLTRYLQARGGWCTLVVATLLSVFLAYIRPVAIVLPPLTAILIFGWGPGHLRRRIFSGLIFLLIGVAGIAALTLRNGLVEGIYTFNQISAVDGYLYRSRAVRAEIEGIDQERMKEIMTGELADSVRLNHWDLHQKLTYQQDYLLRTARDHPWIMLRQAAVGPLQLFRLGASKVMASIANHAEKTRVFSLSARIAWVGEILLSVGSYLLALLGMVILVRERRWTELALAGMLLVWIIGTAAGPTATSRLRVPFLPGLWLLAGVGAAACVEDRLRHSVSMEEKRDGGMEG